MLSEVVHYLCEYNDNSSLFLRYSNHCSGLMRKINTDIQVIDEMT